MNFQPLTFVNQHRPTEADLVCGSEEMSQGYSVCRALWPDFKAQIPPCRCVFALDLEIIEG
jgi:hypothetical protein